MAAFGAWVGTIGAGGGDCAAVRAELLRPGLSGGGALSVDIGGGAGAGLGAGAAAAGAGAAAVVFVAAFAGTGAGDLGAIGITADLACTFAAALTGEPAAAIVWVLDLGAGAASSLAVLAAAGNTKTAFLTIFLPTSAGSGNVLVTIDFLAAVFLATSTTAGDVFSRDFTMYFLWNVACAKAAASMS